MQSWLLCFIFIKFDPHRIKRIKCFFCGTKILELFFRYIEWIRMLHLQVLKLKQSSWVWKIIMNFENSISYRKSYFKADFFFHNAGWFLNPYWKITTLASVSFCGMETRQLKKSSQCTCLELGCWSFPSFISPAQVASLEARRSWLVSCNTVGNVQ